MGNQCVKDSAFANSAQYKSIACSIVDSQYNLLSALFEYPSHPPEVVSVMNAYKSIREHIIDFDIPNLKEILENLQYEVNAMCEFNPGDPFARSLVNNFKSMHNSMRQHLVFVLRSAPKPKRRVYMKPTLANGGSTSIVQGPLKSKSKSNNRHIKIGNKTFSNPKIYGPLSLPFSSYAHSGQVTEDGIPIPHETYFRPNSVVHASQVWDAIKDHRFKFGLDDHFGEKAIQESMEFDYRKRVEQFNYETEVASWLDDVRERIEKEMAQINMCIEAEKKKKAPAPSAPEFESSDSE
jgi:hypothetical protein